MLFFFHFFHFLNRTQYMLLDPLRVVLQSELARGTEVHKGSINMATAWTRSANENPIMTSFKTLTSADGTCVYGSNTVRGENWELPITRLGLWVNIQPGLYLEYCTHIQRATTTCKYCWSSQAGGCPQGAHVTCCLSEGYLSGSFQDKYIHVLYAYADVKFVTWKCLLVCGLSPWWPT